LNLTEKHPVPQDWVVFYWQMLTIGPWSAGSSWVAGAGQSARAPTRERQVSF
jgi:hypothetical protein